VTATERHYGADIGLVVQISAPEALAQKAVLIQTKRLYPTDGTFTAKSEYVELFANDARSLAPQWDRLLGVTSASVYLFYGPERLRIHRGVKRLGTRVIPAHQIGKMWERGTHKMTAEDVYHLGMPLAEWLVREVICCRTGDPSPWAVEAAGGTSDVIPVRQSVRLRVSSSGQTAPFNS
jgi:hypothetical protein